ncbi:FAD-dependent oxidoreductase [Virgibacillus phasianinus]|uniref:FAD-dependent oxidoreductase n=1 Tax=Virgibacillus phasianinus TaxID=2017483 RepID=UPI001FEA5020|nr:FAD-binding oxidoreductase [Virgibacillus phasianinus]
MTELTGRIIRRGDPGYPEARKNFNLYYSKFPEAIVFCEEEKDVLNALKYVRESKVPFRVRSGRHSYQNFSLLDNGIVIDISELNAIKVDTSKDIAVIKAGCELGNVYQTLWQHGRTLPSGIHSSAGSTIPAGTQSSVGIAGLTLGGGIGYLSRVFGLTCDNLLNVRIAVPKGKDDVKVLEANSRKNSELFWACCGGGGGNFGIVTEFTFRIHPIKNVSIFQAEWDFDQLETAFDSWQHWAPFADRRLTSSIELKAKSENTIQALGQFLGSKDELKKLIRPLVKNTSPRKVQVTTIPFNQAVNFFNNPAGNIPSYFKRSGAYIYKPLPNEGIKIMKRFLENAPNENAAIWQQSLAGAVQDKAPSETAYYHRNALIAQEYNTRWTKDEVASRNVQWVYSLRKHLTPYTRGNYVNWPDILIRDWPRTYYGDNFDQLRKVKTKVDPMNVFRFKQSIPPFSN